MSTNEMEQKAAETVRRSGITGERGLAVTVGFASSGTATLEDVLGDVIPGVSVLIGGASRVVLVTERNVYLFKGRRFDRPGALLGSYQIEPGVMSFDGKKVSFPDGQVVYLSDFQGRTLAHAAAVDVHSRSAEEVLKGAGISDERAITVEKGSVPKVTEATAGSRIFDATLGGGELDFRTTSEGRIVLVTDRHVYIFAGSQFSKPGTLLGRYKVGHEVLSRNNQFVTFPSGEVVDFAGVSEAKRVTDAVAGELS
jgi:hypothetical protein